MNRTAKVSVVLPVHNAQARIAAEVERVLEALADLTGGTVEVIVVDDGSKDGTPEVLDELRTQYPQVRMARHRRRLGMEAAGQTGLERATGNLVFIQEDDSPLRMSDLRQLYEVGRDETVVAARAQSQPRPAHGPLLRRLKAWGAAAHDALGGSACNQPVSATSLAGGLQMVRRPHLQMLASRGGKHLRLEAEHRASSSRASSSPVAGGTRIDAPTTSGVDTPRIGSLRIAPAAS